MIVFIIATLGFIFVTAKIDADHLNSQQYFKNHIPRFIQRFGVFVMIALYNLEKAFIFALLFAALFDQVLNLLRGLPLFHLGNTAKWDKFFRKRILLYIAIKALLLTGAIYIIWESLK